MKDKFVTSGIFLIVLLVVSLYLAPFIKNIEGFTGEENIYYKNEKICFRNYVGGLIKNR